MKRKEEIELAWLNKAVQSNHRYDEKSFKEVVEWADKTMINKVCDVLSDLGVFNWMADDAQEGFSPEVYKDQFVKCLTEE